ncbi:MAG: hypothetical protein R3E10_06800 [Gemmatimonadota bacterium]
MNHDPLRDSIGRALGFTRAQIEGTIRVPTVTPPLRVRLGESLGSGVRVTVACAPTDLIELTGEADHPLGLFPASVIASQLLRGEVADSLREEILEWAERNQQRWCEPGGHLTDENPCSLHERG